MTNSSQLINTQTNHTKNVLLIVGPTAVGKTYLSLKLAEKLTGEIVSADSRQIYKFMDIGTAKPTLEERQQASHHFIDIKFPDEYYSAGMYGKEARVVIDQILTAGNLPLVVGGSGLYIRALIDGFFDAEISDLQIKQKLQMRVEEEGLNVLYKYLTRVDPVLANRINPNDTQRIIRALEVWEVSGVPLSRFQQSTGKKTNFNPLFLGLTMDRQRLYQKIESRVDNMIKQGLLEEVSRLADMGYSDELISLQSVGYQEVFEYFKGNLSYVKMVELIKQKSRNYAKRQLTWFRKDKRVNWFNIERLENLNEIVNKIETFKIISS